MSDFIKTITTIDWINVPAGTKFKGVIGYENTVEEGRVLVEDGRIYFCTHNSVYDGSEGSTKLGYPYSWYAANISQEDKDHIDVVLEADPDFVAPPPPPKPVVIKVGSYDCTFHEGHIMVGCTRVDNELVDEITSKLIR